MSHLQFFAYEGQGVERQKRYSYSQAVRVDDRIECSGQGELSHHILPPKAHLLPIPSKLRLTLFTEGGWDPITGEFEKEINTQIDLAFENVDRCLKDAGGKGWTQVYRINSYHVPINNEALEAMVRNFRKWMPDHQPLWTCVGVPRLGEDDMRVEIEVVAHAV
ncbi:endoribonuclease L-PSP [Colletotrichum paranaense]|uniref:Endoribonuclease L-PSP n=1 Tax=Colletotrichum paranaense TaxID=1914294 RepID=A0ABQ9SWA7_9PEZI|nr:endoribonuclease L-PSP [Colletotrichum paranaense]KAK1543798.1 endoribonuclease L-PSP [Colletotrichum paranaense]